jgi:folate-binding protein YgfZ
MSEAPSRAPIFPYGAFARAAVYETKDRVLHISGDDAQSWLSGQVTNDLRELGKREHAVYVLAVSVKGRVLSDGWACLRGDQLALVLPESRVAIATESFDKHIIMEDVELELDQDLRVITVQGPEAANVVASAGYANDAYAAARLGLEGFDLWVPRAELAACKQQLVQAARAVGGDAVDDATWAQAHVLAAVPRCGVDFGEDNYPQEAGLKGRAISFNKGCYLGQEVICMLENRGQLARRLVQLEAPGTFVLAAETNAFDGDGKRVGDLTSAAVTPAGQASTDSPKTVALAYLKRPVAELGKRVRAGEREWVVRAVVGAETDECPIVAR